MKKKAKKPWAVFIAIILAVIIGSVTGKEANIWGLTFYSIFDTVGSLFINALKLIVIPLVSASIITGIAKIGNDAAFGRLGLKIFGFYIGTTLLAVLTGLICVNLFQPGYVDSTSVINQAHPSAQLDMLKASETTSLTHIFQQIIPSNIFLAFSQGNMLGLIFFSLLFGYAISKIEDHAGAVLLNFSKGVFQAMLKITHIVMKFLPIGVFCLVAKVFAVTGIDSFKSVFLFSITVIVGLALFTFGVLPLLLKFIGKVRPSRHFKAMAPALITAFSTSSSSATLPVALECAEKRAKISNRISSLVIPLGTSINLAGSALYECVAALFVAQAYGIEISFATQFVVVILALITSMGVAGIPSASLVAILVILNALGLPAEGIGLFLAVDRLLDMCRTTVNVFSDSCCAVLVARLEGEKQVLSSDEFEEL